MSRDWGALPGGGEETGALVGRLHGGWGWGQGWSWAVFSALDHDLAGDP